LKPTTELGRVTTPDGSELRLTERDGEYLILLKGYPLMSSRAHGSEEALADLACGRLRTAKRPSVLVGGLGMGFTLRAALDLMPPSGSVTVAELIPEVVEWNRGPLAELAGRPLEDPRTRLEIADVGAVIRAGAGRFDAILMDVDNGPEAFTFDANSGLYSAAGLAAIHRALKAGGTMALWSSFDDRGFVGRLNRHGFQARAQRARAHGGKGWRHTIFLGIKQDSRSSKKFPKKAQA